MKNTEEVVEHYFRRIQQGQLLPILVSGVYQCLKLPRHTIDIDKIKDVSKSMHEIFKVEGEDVLKRYNFKVEQGTTC